MGVDPIPIQPPFTIFYTMLPNGRISEKMQYRHWDFQQHHCFNNVGIS